jgi:hypothetical protein
MIYIFAMLARTTRDGSGNILTTSFLFFHSLALLYGTIYVELDESFARESKERKAC